MKPRPATGRIRKTIKWVGAAVTVLLVTLWIASGWWTLTWRVSSGHFFHVWMSDIVIGQDPFFKNAVFQGVHLDGPHRFELHWSFAQYKYPRGWAAATPVWALVAAAMVATAVLFLLDRSARRRARLNFCPNCNYDRTGLAAGTRCPECGSVPTA